MRKKKTLPVQKKNDGGGSPAGRSSAVCVGADLRTYRLAVACTGEYAKAATGFTAPTVAQTLAKVITTINRVDGVYEREVSVRMILVPSSTLVLYTDPATDSFTGTANTNATQLLNLSQSVITASIGNANYDIGHTFSTGGGGLANFACVCVSSQKAKGITGSTQPFGDPYDIDYVAHEMGHQFGANHTFNAITDNCNFNRNAPTSIEPGSGVTIMGYAGICGMNNITANSIPYFHAISYDEIVNFTNSGTGSGCAVVSSSGNQPPVVTGSAAYTIPKSTPFYLSGSATDPDGDVLTYSWEETDAGSAGANWNSGNKPFFRSYAPDISPIRLFPRASVVASNNFTSTMGEFLPQTAQTLNFRLTARDNKMGGGGVCYSSTQITVDTSGPLTVSYPSLQKIYWVINTPQSVTWDPNFTNQQPVNCNSVRILISYNSGLTYSVFVASAPNTGYQAVTVPNLSNTINTCRIKVESIGNVFYDVSDNDFTISTDPFASVSEERPYNPLALSVWPNPAGNMINFLSGNIDQSYTTYVTVCDVLGNTIYTNSYLNKTVIRDQISIDQLSAGVYFIKVSNGRQNSVQRIIKN